jgi:major membrane immunogen (membrane-anchored lipoprotein)
VLIDTYLFCAEGGAETLHIESTGDEYVNVSFNIQEGKIKIKAEDLLTAAKAIKAILKEQEPRTLSENRVKVGNHYAHNVDHIIMTGC